MKEYRVQGPPGCGKTTYIRRQVERAANVYGANKVAVCSLTRTAAANVAAVADAIPPENIGTIHALAFRAVNAGKIAEGSLGEFNDYCAEHKQPLMKLTAGKAKETPDSEDIVDVPTEGETPGDHNYNEMNRMRAQMRRVEMWPDSVRAFSHLWNNWKRDAEALDFTDLLETALRDVAVAPGDPGAFMVDESQDCSRLTFALVRKWGERAITFIHVGDKDQILFQWCGVDPQSFSLTNLPADQVKTLSQSFRVPRAVHALAVKWISQTPHRAPVEYAPRDADGAVLRNVSATISNPKAAIDYAKRKIGEGKSVMFMTTCGYMLYRTIGQLRDAGIPFHNPYRCSPPDEFILTTDGWIPIGGLDPAIHRLAGYYSKTNSLSWGGRSGPKTNKSERGFSFSVSREHFDGHLIVAETMRSRTRITPNHRVKARFSDAYYNKWVVYLMRRGNWWRIGQVCTGPLPGNVPTSSISNRMTTENADSVWLLGIYSSKNDASLAEATMQFKYRISGVTFERPLGQLDVQKFHDSTYKIASEGANLLLNDFGLDIDNPLFTKGNLDSRTRTSGYAFETVAANLLSDIMEFPVIPDGFLDYNSNRITPEWHKVTISRERYCGDVFSLDVPDTHYYVSGCAIVHNSTRGDWNPLNTRGTSAAARLIAFAKANPKYCRPGEIPSWTWGDVARWSHWIKATGVMQRGAKKRIEDYGKQFTNEPVDFMTLVKMFDEVHWEGIENVSLQWWGKTLPPERSKQLNFPVAILRQGGILALEQEPQVIVTTIHAAKGGEADCSPGDEPVLTTNRGYVAIADLNPEYDRLVSFNSDHHKIHRGGPRRPDGYHFTKGSRPYSGELITVVTETSKTRVTPNHIMTVRWLDGSLYGWVVYLMRRGNWWRIGITSLHYKLNNQVGVNARMQRELAEDAWILGSFSDRDEALYYECLWSHLYGVPELGFSELKNTQRKCMREDRLHSVWNAIDSQSGAHKLLRDRGLNPAFPIWTTSDAGLRRRRQAGVRNRWQIRACNLIPELMAIPTDPGYGQEPAWRPFALHKEHFSGPVYSLDVERWHHYISGGAVVHNCVVLFSDLSPAAHSDWMGGGEGKESVRRAIYVGMTRAREELVICPPATNLSVVI